jgi:hypothetical protein
MSSGSPSFPSLLRGRPLSPDNQLVAGPCPRQHFCHAFPPSQLVYFRLLVVVGGDLLVSFVSLLATVFLEGVSHG